MKTKRLLGQLTALALLTTLLTPLTLTPASAAAPKPGSSCSKLWQTKVFKSVRHTCVRVNRKLVWNRGVSIARPRPPAVVVAPVVIPPRVTSIPIYRGGSGSGTATPTPELPFLPASAPAGVNLKLFVHLPEAPQSSLRSPGVWTKPAGEDWRFVRANGNGSVFLSLKAGSHLIDTVEPDGNMIDFKRKTYEAIVTEDGAARVRGILPNSTGFFGLTVDRAERVGFTPSNQCQLLGQDGNLSINQGFPARPDRLPRTGTIRALIIPVDFADVPGTDRPETAFFEMATLTDEFFRKMSGGAVSFSFQVLPEYVRMPFASNFFKLGTWSEGDAGGYWNAALKAADPLVDYSQFDVVYVLSPKTIPWTSIAYGPAFPSRTMTDDGYVKNGTFSGADAYQAFPGAGWKWMAHETGHLFGLHDLYTVPPQDATYGSWDIMSLNWSNKAIELNSWNRFLMDWMPEGSFNCLSVSAARSLSSPIAVSPIASTAPGMKSIMIPLSAAEILVMEYRANAGLDSIPSSETGLLVFTVSMTTRSLRGGWKVIRPTRSISPTFEDAALRVGESVSVGGLTITVDSEVAGKLMVSIR